MSWSCTFNDTPAAVAELLDKEVDKYTGVSREEFEAALPHLKALVLENFTVESEGAYSQPVVRLTASGHGSHRDGKALHRELRVTVEPTYEVK